MIYNLRMEIVKIKIQNLINKRQLAIQLFAVVIGGLIGLLLIPFTIKTAIFTMIGLYYSYVLLNNYIKLDAAVEKLIKEQEANKI